MTHIRSAVLWPVHKLLKLADALFGPLLARAGIRIVGVHLPRIGELGIALELWAKMGELGWRPRYHAVLIAPSRRVSNRAYLDYWRPYLHIVTSPLLTAILEHAEFTRHLHYLPPGPDPVRSHRDRDDVTVALSAEWERQGRPPLLRLTEEHARKGRSALRELGMPDDAWFAAVHVREPGYLQEDPSSHRWHRNVNVETYVPAIRAIVERGGWVVRLGDPTMTKLPPLEHTIDYPHLDIRADWLDVYLAAACRFLLGTTSGMCVVSHTFGVPFAASNYVPFSSIPWSDKNVYIPKLYRSASLGRLLTFEEMLQPDLIHLDHGVRLRERGIEFVDNSPDELIALTNEMLARLENTMVYTDEDEALQARYWSLFAHLGDDVRCRVGRDFLRAHTNLLPD